MLQHRTPFHFVGSRTGAVLTPEPSAFPLNNDDGKRECTMTTGADDSATDLVGLGALGAGIGHMPASWDLEAAASFMGGNPV
jgi:hypothetical protein